jgi:aminoglycoside phosphotransferase (APT) family kinase protein
MSESARAKTMPLDEPVVRRLLTAQFPQWAHLPITPAIPQGWDNRTFRLGEEMSVRLPSAAEYVPQVAKIHRYLPLLAPLLPLPIPLPLAQGEPGEGYPFPWSICSWLPGETAVTAPSLDLSEMAHALADFLIALAHIDATGGPTSGQHSAFRGGSLAVFDAETRQAIQALSTTINGPLALAIWEAARATSWEGTPVWFHGDVASPNLLVQQGSLSAVKVVRQGMLPKSAFRITGLIHRLEQDFPVLVVRLKCPHRDRASTVDRSGCYCGTQGAPRHIYDEPNT